MVNLTLKIKTNKTTTFTMLAFLLFPPYFCCSSTPAHSKRCVRLSSLAAIVLHYSHTRARLFRKCWDFYVFKRRLSLELLSWGSEFRLGGGGYHSVYHSSFAVASGPADNSDIQIFSNMLSHKSNFRVCSYFALTCIPDVDIMAHGFL